MNQTLMGQRSAENAIGMFSLKNQIKVKVSCFHASSWLRKFKLFTLQGNDAHNDAMLNITGVFTM